MRLHVYMRPKSCNKKLKHWFVNSLPATHTEAIVGLVGLALGASENTTANHEQRGNAAVGMLVCKAQVRIVLRASLTKQLSVQYGARSKWKQKLCEKTFAIARRTLFAPLTIAQRIFLQGEGAPRKCSVLAASCLNQVLACVNV